MRTHHTRMRTGRAFTLVELLVVISLIAILATLVISVGSAVRGQAAENQTRAMLRAVQGAIDSFRDAQGNRPPQVIVDWRDPAHPPAYFNPADPGYSAAANVTLRMDCAKANSWRLLQQLERVQDAWSRIEALPEDFLENAVVDRNPLGAPNTITDEYLIDSFENPVNYQAAAGAGGTPVVISAGGNGVWGDGDDLRSDDL